MGEKRQRWRSGAVVTVPLPDGSLGYGQMLEEPEYAFFGLRTEGQAAPAQPPEVVARPVLFRLWVARHAHSRGRWTKIGEAPLTEAMRHPVLRFNQDPLNPQRIHLGYHGEKGRPVTVEECAGLERAAVWEPVHVEERLVDHFAGRPNGWVESLRPRPARAR